MFSKSFRIFKACLFLIVVWTIVPNVAAEQKPGHPAPQWQGWSESVFSKAKLDRKLVLLNLEAVWCHWCHVMAAKTYSNPEIISVLGQHYVAIKVDQDSRPDLSLRYQDYGWPATIIFDSLGNELLKRAGYIPANEMSALLNDLVKNPSPRFTLTQVSPKAESHGRLTPELKAKLNDRHITSFDSEKGGLKTNHKYLDPDSVELNLVRAKSGDVSAGANAKKTLDANLALIDPAWGGVYQYSTRRDWNNPHFEKLATSQANNLYIYALAYQLFGAEAYKSAATKIHAYLETFLLSPEGGFFTSQDADLKKGEHSQEYFNLSDGERRKLGLPAIDKNIYARENGKIIFALANWYASSGDNRVLDQAKNAAAWIQRKRALPGGGFAHGEDTSNGPYLGDTLSMGRAMLMLYLVTGERSWLQGAMSAAKFIAENFFEIEAGNKLPGAIIASRKPSDLLPPVRNLDENIELTRFANLLFRVTGKSEYQVLADLAMRYIAIPEVATEHITDSGVLIADQELSTAPLHITIVGPKDDPGAKALFVQGLAYFSPYKRVEWWDKREGPLLNPDVEYPALPKAAAFICTESRCSLPIFKAEKLIPTIEQLIRPNL